MPMLMLRDRPKQPVLPLLAAALLHGLILFIPAERKAAPSQVNQNGVSVQLVFKEEQELLVPLVPAAPVVDRIELVPNDAPMRDSVEQKAQSRTAQAKPIPQQTEEESIEPQEPVHPGLATRILSSPYLEDSPRNSDPFAIRDETKTKVTGFQFADRSIPDSTLNPPELELPFADTPRLVVDFYDNGLMGDFQRFRDSVTWSKTWTSKNGTKFGCALVLVIPACAWD